MDSWFEQNLVCPRDQEKIQFKDGKILCPKGHVYPCVEGIPIMLLNEEEATHDSHFKESREIASGNSRSSEIKQKESQEVDAYVQDAIVGTCGLMYRNMLGKLKRYPIPSFPLKSSAQTEYLLDIGCNWGRWCVSAARAGYSPVGIDPSFKAVQAAGRVAAQLGVKARYLVADARHLPFPKNFFDVVFSYSVLQHFGKSETRKTLQEIKRVLKSGGVNLIQMLNSFGLRNQYSMLKRAYREPEGFEVRYWTPCELREAFETVGPTDVEVDGFFSANVQTADMDLLSFPYRCVVRCSEFLKKLSFKLPFLVQFADSLYMKSKKKGDSL